MHFFNTKTIREKRSDFHGLLKLDAAAKSTLDSGKRMCHANLNKFYWIIVLNSIENSQKDWKLMNWRCAIAYKTEYSESESVGVNWKNYDLFSHKSKLLCDGKMPKLTASDFV